VEKCFPVLTPSILSGGWSLTMYLEGWMELMINHFLFINAHQSGSLFVFFQFLDHLQWCSVYDPAKIFFTSMFSYLLFRNPTHKTEIGTAYRCRTTNSKSPGPIIMMGQSETLIDSQIIFITLFSACEEPCCTFYQHSKLCNSVEPKLFSWAKPSNLDFSWSNFTKQDHVLRTAGDALSEFRHGLNQRHQKCGSSVGIKHWISRKKISNNIDVHPWKGWAF
jgi:hypothetical protein